MNTTLHTNRGSDTFLKNVGQILKSEFSPTDISFFHSKGIESRSEQNFVVFENWGSICGSPVCLVVVVLCQCGCAAPAGTGVDRCH